MSDPPPHSIMCLFLRTGRTPTTYYTFPSPSLTPDNPFRYDSSGIHYTSSTPHSGLGCTTPTPSPLRRIRLPLRSSFRNPTFVTSTSFLSLHVSRKNTHKIKVVTDVSTPLDYTLGQNFFNKIEVLLSFVLPSGTSRHQFSSSRSVYSQLRVGTVITVNPDLF